MKKGSDKDLFVLPDNESFMVQESSLDYLFDSPLRISHGVVILCINGNGKMTVNFEKYALKKYSQIVLMPQSIITLRSKSEDFQVICFSFSLSIFNEAFFLIDSSVFEFLKNNALYDYPPGEFQQKMYFFELIKALFNDKENKFRNKMVTNYLQNYFLDIFDKIYRIPANQERKKTSRKEELFKAFVQSVHKNYMYEKEVCFYANELSISTRYLSSITRSIDNSTAKEFIDNCVTQEIKLLLHSPNLSIQEIADRLNFQDQSNLSRFFKKQTGISPTAYRKRK